MQWWVIVRLQVAVPPMWQKEARKHSQLTKLIENKVNEGRGGLRCRSGPSSSRMSSMWLP
jgi:hypothetical protein